MLGKIARALSKKAVSTEDLVEAINREIVPVLIAVRDAVNSALVEDERLSLVNRELVPALGTSGSYQEVDAGTSVYTGIVFDPDDYPLTNAGRTRELYVHYVGRMSGSSTSVSFELYDGTDGAEVPGSEFTTTSSTPEDSGLIGPLSLASGAHEYVVRSKRADGTAEAHLLVAELVVHYT